MAGDERDTLPPPPDVHDEAVAREIRRSAYVTGHVDEALSAIRCAIGSDELDERGTVAHLLERAWDDGASRETDLRLAVAVLQEQMLSVRALFERQYGEIISLRTEVRELRAELAEERRLRRELEGDEED